MIVIPVKEGEVIDRALKRFKKKFMRTGTLKQIRGRKEAKNKRERNSKNGSHKRNINGFYCRRKNHMNDREVR